MAKSKQSPVHTRTHEEIIKETTDQLKALDSLAIAFGRGHAWAAKLMATVISTICHDGWDQRSKSLITQLGWRSGLMCITTARKPIHGDIFAQTLTLAWDPVGPKRAPRWALFPRATFEKIPFEDWWAEPVYTDASGVLTRKDVVHIVRSQDGGAHFDAHLTSQQYLGLRTGAGIQRCVGDNFDNPLPSEPTHLLTVWSIAWELYFSFSEVT
jgi:hypothetical protein